MGQTTLRGGDRLKAKLAEIAGKLKKADKLEVGFPGGDTYSDGTSIAMVAAIQEFGAPSVGIPPRPFFRSMIAAENPQWGEKIGKLLVENGL